MTLVQRVQGLIVPRNNPKAIGTLLDLGRQDVRFVNRQRGSGTRVLLDYKLTELGLTPEAIEGYDREEFTHLAVAALVSSGVCDTGLGILAAAKAMGLEFVPLFQERYDLAIPKEFLDSPLLEPLFDVIHSRSFRQDVEALGGYDVSEMGRVVLDIG